MKIVCIANSGEALPDQFLDESVGYKRSMEFPLTIGRGYVVYAVEFRLNQVWYYISDDDDFEYPMATPAPLFEVVDGRVSRYWEYAYTPGHLDHFAILAFKEWIEDRFFYDRLTDKKEPELSVFQRMRNLIDEEARTSSIA
jgi:hypothetical protein